MYKRAVQLFSDRPVHHTELPIERAARSVRLFDRLRPAIGDSVATRVGTNVAGVGQTQTLRTSMSVALSGGEHREDNCAVWNWNACTRAWIDASTNRRRKLLLIFALPRFGLSSSRTRGYRVSISTFEIRSRVSIERFCYDDRPVGFSGLVCNR